MRLFKTKELITLSSLGIVPMLATLFLTYPNYEGTQASSSTPLEIPFPIYEKKISVGEERLQVLWPKWDPRLKTGEVKARLTALFPELTSQQVEAILQIWNGAYAGLDDYTKLAPQGKSKKEKRKRAVAWLAKELRAREFQSYPDQFIENVASLWEPNPKERSKNWTFFLLAALVNYFHLKQNIGTLPEEETALIGSNWSNNYGNVFNDVGNITPDLVQQVIPFVYDEKLESIQLSQVQWKGNWPAKGNFSSELIHSLDFMALSPSTYEKQRADFYKERKKYVHPFHYIAGVLLLGDQTAATCALPIWGVRDEKTYFIYGDPIALSAAVTKQKEEVVARMTTLNEKLGTDVVHISPEVGVDVYVSIPPQAVEFCERNPLKGAGRASIQIRTGFQDHRMVVMPLFTYESSSKITAGLFGQFDQLMRGRLNENCSIPEERIRPVFSDTDAEDLFFGGEWMNFDDTPGQLKMDAGQNKNWTLVSTSTMRMQKSDSPVLSTSFPDYTVFWKAQRVAMMPGAKQVSDLFLWYSPETLVPPSLATIPTRMTDKLYARD